MKKMMNWRQFLWTVGLLLAVFLVLFLILHSQLTGRRQQESALRMTLTRLEEENQAMDTQLKQVDTEEYVVSSAMTNYAFMNRNDLRFQFTNPDALYAYTEDEIKILMDELAD